MHATRGKYQVTTAPTLRALTAAEVRTHCNIEYTDADATDAFLEALIDTATAYVEGYTNRFLLTQTLTMALPCFPVASAVEPFGYLEILGAPLQEFKKLEYFDSENTLQTFYDLDGGNTTNLIFDTVAQPARINLAKDKTWPSHYTRTDAIKLTYVVGWSSAGNVPAPIKQAMLLIVAELFERRENYVKKLPTAAEYLLSIYKVSHIF